MERRDFLRTVGCGSGRPVVRLRDSPREEKEEAEEKPVARTERPNILWLISEDTCPDMACYGNTLVKTPNIDKLAREGARFTNAFVTAPVCSASRSAIMTGMYQTTIDAHNHRSHRSDGYKLTPPVTVITESFPAAGYFTSQLRRPELQEAGQDRLELHAERQGLRRHGLVAAQARPAVLRPDQLQHDPPGLPAGQEQSDRSREGRAAALLPGSSRHPAGLGRLPRIDPGPRQRDRRGAAVAGEGRGRRTTRS